jgi:hypothetical protein
MKQKIIPIIFTVAILLFGMKISSARADDDLVAHWNFNEGSGTVLHDVSGHGHDGTIHGATWVEGRDGKALQLDGVSNYVEIPDAADLDLSSDGFTIEALVYADATQATGTGMQNMKEIISKGGYNDSSASYQLYFFSSLGRYMAALPYGPDTATQCLRQQFSSDDKRGQWMRVFMVLNSKGLFRTYYNGLRVASPNLPEGQILQQNNTNLWFGGSATDGAGRFFKGKIEDVKIWKKVLSEGEIASQSNFSFGFSDDKKTKHLIMLGVQACFKRIAADDLEALDGSPFDGHQLLIGAGSYCGGSPSTNYSDFSSFISTAKNSKHKFWPAIRVFFMDDSTATLDIYDKEGGLTKFYAYWTNALRLAKDTGSPGILFDPEDYGTDIDLSSLATKNNTTVEAVNQRIHEIGAHMADIVNETYPEATINQFFVYWALNWTDKCADVLAEGMLDQAKAENYPFTFSVSGELSGTFLPVSLYGSQYSLNEKIFNNANIQSKIAQYPNLDMGAWTGYWNDYAHLTSFWANQNPSLDSAQIEIQKTSDFKPLFKWFFKNFRNVNIIKQNYSTNSSEDFDDFTPSVQREEYRKTLKDALIEVYPLDINFDRKIDGYDVNEIDQNFLKDSSSWLNPYADINKDSKITVKDLGILMSGWK